MKTKLLSVVLAVLMAISMITVAPAVSAKEKATVNGVAVNVGDTVVVTYYAKSTDLWENCQGYVDYDTTGLEFLNFEMPNITTGMKGYNNVTDDSKVYYHGSSLDYYDFTTEGIVFVAKFKVVALGNYTVANTWELIDSDSSESLADYGVINEEKLSFRMETTVIPVNYGVVYNLTNAVSSSLVSEIKSGDSYSTTISPDEGFEIKSLSCKNGDEDVECVADGENYIISIDNVVGNIVITAVAEKKEEPTSETTVTETTTEPSSETTVTETSTEPSSETTVTETKTEPSSETTVTETSTEPSSETTVTETTTEPSSETTVTETTSESTSATIVPTTISTEDEPTTIATPGIPATQKIVVDASAVMTEGAVYYVVADGKEYELTAENGVLVAEIPATVDAISIKIVKENTVIATTETTEVKSDYVFKITGWGTELGGKLPVEWVDPTSTSDQPTTVTETTTEPSSETTVTETKAEPSSETTVTETSTESTSVTTVTETSTEPSSETTVTETKAEPSSETTVTETITEPSSETTVTETTTEPSSETTVTETKAEPSSETTVTESTTESTSETTNPQPTTKPVVKVTAVKLNATSKVLNRGRVTILRATVYPSNANYKAVSWSSTNKKVAVVTQSGLVTAKYKGFAYIRATAKDGSKKFAQCRITVKQPVTAVKLNATAKTLNRGSRTVLKATVYPTNANVRTVSWKSFNTRVATVTSKGVVTAKSKGVTYVRATAKDGSRKYAQCKITVKQPVTTVKLNVKAKTLKRGAKLTLKATVSPSNANVRTVTWKSTNTKVVTVTSKGVVTAKAKGTTYVRATAKDGSKKYAQCKITVIKR